MLFSATFATKWDDGVTNTQVRLRLRGEDGTEYGPFAMTGTVLPNYDGTDSDRSEFTYTWAPPSSAWNGRAYYTPDNGETPLIEAVNLGSLSAALSAYNAAAPPAETTVPATGGPYDIGDTVPLTSAFVDADGVAADPDTVTLTITDPDGTATDYTGTDLTHTGTGIWRRDVVPDASGYWGVRWVGTGTVSDSSRSLLYVRQAV